MTATDSRFTDMCRVELIATLTAQKRLGSAEQGARGIFINFISALISARDYTNTVDRTRCSGYSFTGRGVLKQSSDSQLMSAFMAVSSASNETLASTRLVCCDESCSSRVSSWRKRNKSHSKPTNNTTENPFSAKELMISKTELPT